MRTIFFRVIVTFAIIGITTLVLATPAKKTLTQVTVSVQGLHCQGCVDELQRDLSKISGVSAVKVTQQPAQATAKLDETTIAASKFVAAISIHPQFMNHAKTYGARLLVFVDAPGCAGQAKMCPACFTEIPKVLKTVKGIDTVSLDDTGKVVFVTFTHDANITTQSLVKALSTSAFKFTTCFIAPKTTAQHNANSGNTGGCCNGCKM